MTARRCGARRRQRPRAATGTAAGARRGGVDYPRGGTTAATAAVASDEAEELTRRDDDARRTRTAVRGRAESSYRRGPSRTAADWLVVRNLVAAAVTVAKEVVMIKVARLAHGKRGRLLWVADATATDGIARANDSGCVG